MSGIFLLFYTFAFQIEVLDTLESTLQCRYNINIEIIIIHYTFLERPPLKNNMIN